ncbi:MAG: ABC transporter permease [Lachnospiraceae bacterium]|nr:ABC transporter permease [Lachnospiraceae bacterium]
MNKVTAKLYKAFRYLVKSGIVTWLLVILIWFYASHFYLENFFPDPVKTVTGGWEIIANGKLWEYILISSYRVFSGWFLGFILAVPLGILIGRINFLRELVEPFVNFFRFVPAIAFLTLFLMWFGVGERSKIILIMYSTWFTVLINTLTGVMSINPTKIYAARTLGASEWQIIYSIVLPSVTPYIFTGARLGLGNAFTSIVTAEMLAAKSGIGYMIYTSRLYFRIDWIFVGIITLGLMGYFSDKIMRVIGATLLKRYGVKEQIKFGQEG